MFPLHKDFYKQEISQPLYFINSHNFQWVVNVKQMMSLTKKPDADGITPCRVLTIEYVYVRGGEGGEVIRYI